MTKTKVGPRTPASQSELVDQATIPERIYLASPKYLYGTIRLRRAIGHLREGFPHAVILLPSELFRGRADWIARFPAVLDALTRLVFLADDEGFIGRGVASECHAVLQRGKPVELITESGLLIPCEHLQLSPPNDADWVRYRRVSLRPAAE